MYADHPLGKLPADKASYGRAPVTAVRPVARVAQIREQPIPQFSDARRPVAGLGRDLREAVPRQRRHEDIEGVRGIAAVGAGIGQRFDDLVEFVESAGPAVGEHERQGIGALSDRVDVVHAEAVDLAHVMVVAVECRLLPAPVEAIGPVRAQFLKIGPVGAVGPATVGDLGGPTRALETRAQVFQRRVRDFDLKRRCGHVVLRCRRVLPGRYRCRSYDQGSPDVCA